MSLAETIQEQETYDGPALLGPEMSDDKNRVGPDEAARLMVIGSFNARIQARKSMLGALGKLPYPPFDNQDETLAEEIEQLRAERDATIYAGVRNPAIYHRPALKLVTRDEVIIPQVRDAEFASAPLLEAPDTQPEPQAAAHKPESLQDRLGRLSALAHTYAALATQIGNTLDELQGQSTDEVFAVTDLINDTGEQITQASDWLTEQSNALVDAVENPETDASDSDTDEATAEPEVAEPLLAPSAPETKVIPQAPPMPTPQPATQPVSPSAATEKQSQETPRRKPSLKDDELDKKLKAVPGIVGQRPRKPQQRGRSRRS